MRVFAHAGGFDLLEAAPALLACLAALAYLAAARALRRRGRHWSRWRELSFLAGVGLLVFALASPAVLGAGEDFRAHVAQHLLIGMLAPIALVMAAPVTLTLRTLPREAKKAVSPIFTSRSIGVLTHPATVVVLDVGALYALYLTPLYGTVQSDPLAHAAMHFHMFAAGFLFAWVIVGLDPSAHRAPGWMRLGALVVAAAAHATLAKLLYAHGLPHEAAIRGAELRDGAQLMYYGGDVAELLLAGVLIAGLIHGSPGRSRWSRHTPSQRPPINPTVASSG